MADPKLTQKDIKGLVDNVARRAHVDDEAAHGNEDVLFEVFVRSLANDNLFGGRVPVFIKRAAKLVMSSKNIDFQRHCA